jgi:hypothetical protein
LLINKSGKVVVQIHTNYVLIIRKINFCKMCIFTGGWGWNNVIPAPLAKNEFFSVNKLRTNFENSHTNYVIIENYLINDNIYLFLKYRFTFHGNNNVIYG